MHTHSHIHTQTHIQGPWHYSPDQISDLPLRSIVAEITRESVLLRAHEEVPYVAFVETEKYEERKDGSVKIDQVVRTRIFVCVRLLLLFAREEVRCMTFFDRYEERKDKIDRK
jgi:hypothetical protein